MKLGNLNDVNIGIDLVEISRFKKIPFDKNKSFYRKNFSEDEIKYCLKFSEPYKHFAGKFAIKEAAKKSINKKLELCKIRTYHVESKPGVRILDDKHEFKVSVSHEKNYAIAIVINKN